VEIPRQPFECSGSNLDLIDWMDWQMGLNGLSAAAVARVINRQGEKESVAVNGKTLTPK